MNTITLTTIVAILATALILTPLNPAHAANVALVEDGRKQLSPKSFGSKTLDTACKNNICVNLDETQKGKLSPLKKEEIKTFKKIDEQWKAIKLMKSYYKLG